MLNVSVSLHLGLLSQVIAHIFLTLKRWAMPKSESSVMNSGNGGCAQVPSLPPIVETSGSLTFWMKLTQRRFLAFRYTMIQRNILMDSQLLDCYFHLLIIYD